MQIFIALGLLVLAYIFTYNALVRSRQKALQAWSGIDVQLRRRHDLIPLLVKTVEGYVQQERSVLSDVTALRAEAMTLSNEQRDKIGQIENSLANRLATVFALAERYPNLKSDAHFMKLQEELSETEDQIAAARNIFNSNAARFNSRIESFPINFVAMIHRFRTLELFNA